MTETFLLTTAPKGLIGTEKKNVSLPLKKSKEKNQKNMRKAFTSLTIIVCAVMFCSCGDNFVQGMFELVSGKATSLLGGNKSTEYTSSIVMIEDEPNPYALGLSMSIEVEDLMNLSGVEDLSFPFLSYRMNGEIKSGQTINVNNVLTEEDVENFDYEWLLNGKFADNNIVAIAESDTKFYIMSTGSINLAKVTKTKVKGSYSGTAYVIDLNATPMLSEEKISISGNFTSRTVSIMKWLLDLQEENGGEFAGN